jgi:hypothetical protein
MGVRWIAAVVLVAMAGPALAENGSRLQLASLAPPLGHQSLEGLSGASAGLPERLALAPAGLAELKRPPVGRIRGGRALKPQLRPVVASAPDHDPASMDGIGAGYTTFFGPSVPLPFQPGATVEPRPEPQGEPAIWTVFSGPAGHRAAAQLSRSADLGRPAELLLALRAGF